MTIADEFTRISILYPDHTAIKSEKEGTLSYRELNSYADYIAALLHDKTGGTNDIVGICINRSFLMIASILGVLKAGKAYLPLDPSYPQERLEYMLNNSKVHDVLCSTETIDVLENLHNKICADFYENSYERLAINIDEQSLAYIQYTSGSTGVPNGVLITHRSIMNTLKWRIGYYNLNQYDANIQIPSFSFASSVEDIFCTLLSGGTLVLLNAKDLLNPKLMKHLINKYSVTHLLMVPSLYREILRELGGVKTLRFVTVAGEALYRNLVYEHYRILPETILYNEYGMTETSVACIVNKVKLGLNEIPIGKTIDNMQSMILNQEDDGVGELHITGKGLAKGYHNNEKSTKERFVYIEDVRYFNTGDYVKESADGNLIFIGRRDNQIKINGQRVNLSEIDNILQQDVNVYDSITCCMNYSEKDIIVSFIQTDLDDNDYYYKLLQKALPKFYIPDHIKVQK